MHTQAAPVEFTGRATVDGRTGLQWLKSAVAYCDFRAGDSWRNLSDQEQRNDELRWWYLNGARTLYLAMNGGLEPGRPHLAVSSFATSPAPSPFEQELARRLTRPELVRRLMHADAKLTDRRILSGFTRAKLARLIVEAERRNRNSFHCRLEQRRSA